MTTQKTLTKTRTKVLTATVVAVVGLGLLAGIGNFALHRSSIYNAPDLTAQIERMRCMADGSVSYYATVRNVGRRRASFFLVTTTATNSYGRAISSGVPTRTIDTLGPRQRRGRSVIIPASRIAGTGSNIAALRITADPDNRIRERRENNNSSDRVQISCADFQVGSVATDSTETNIVLINAGTTVSPAISAGYSVRWLNNSGNPLSLKTPAGFDPMSGSIPSLEPSVFFDREWFNAVQLRFSPPPSNAAYLEVRLDVDNELSESNEENNLTQYPLDY